MHPPQILKKMLKKFYLFHLISHLGFPHRTFTVSPFLVGHQNKVHQRGCIWLALVSCHFGDRARGSWELARGDVGHCNFLGLGAVRSINGVAEMKDLNINIKSNNRKLCQQRKQQSFLKHFNVLPVIGHFFSSFLRTSMTFPLLCKTYQWNIEKNYIWNIWSI